MAGRLSLAQQIALLEEPAPVELDPDDDHLLDIGSGPSLEPLAREHYVDVGPSLLRKQHDSISDPKYQGVSVTRKQVMQQDNVGDMDDVDTAGEEGEGSESGDNEPRSHNGTEEPGSDSDEPSEVEVESAAPASETISPLGRRPSPAQEAAEGLSTELRKMGAEDRRKGMAVSRQLGLWDILLDARIRIQKAAIGANRLPPPLEVKEYLASPDCKDSVEKLLRETALLSNDLFQLQEFLFKSNESLTPPPSKRRRVETGGDGDFDFAQWLEDATEDVSSFEKFYHPHLVQTLAKWSSKIQAVSPAVLLPPNRNAFSSRRSQNTQNILELIDEVAVDGTKLLARTQIRRTTGARVSASGPSEINQEQDPNIFDDTDFYQQMLRDVIDARGNGSGGDWMAVQKQKKARKTVDTKASKGRKLRYEAHEKLRNFMVPVPVVGSWHEEQIDELFASLLGKGFDTLPHDISVEQAAERQHQETVTLGEALKDGFRVFG